MEKQKTTLLVLSISDPILIGIYKDGFLEELFRKEGKTSEVLPLCVEEILKKEEIDELIYVNGPGGYMSIKITYIFLKTLSITLGIPFLAMSGFECNQNSPIKALGKKYFYLQEDGVIGTRFLEEDEKIEIFELPSILDYAKCSYDPLPNYQLPAV